MKYLFLLSLAAMTFFLFNIIIQILKNKKDFFKRKLPARRPIHLDPRFNKALIFAGGKKNALVFLILAAIVLIASGNIIFVLIIAVFYFYILWNIKDSKAKKLKNLIDKQTIEALTTIKNAVLAGKSIQDALILTAADIKDPLKTEFEKMAQDLSLGASLDSVLSKASNNAPSKEFKLMADTIRLSAESGASLSGIFERITDAASQRIELFEKVSALTAQGKMSGNVVSSVPFVVMIMMSLLQPDMTNVLFNTFIGNILLLIVTGMTLMGSFLIRKLTEVDY